MGGGYIVLFYVKQDQARPSVSRAASSEALSPLPPRQMHHAALDCLPPPLFGGLRPYVSFFPPDVCARPFCPPHHRCTRSPWTPSPMTGAWRCMPRCSRWAPKERAGGLSCVWGGGGCLTTPFPTTGAWHYAAVLKVGPQKEGQGALLLMKGRGPFSPPLMEGG